MRREILDRNMMCFQHLELKWKKRSTSRVFGLHMRDINFRSITFFRYSDGIKTAQNVRSVNQAEEFQVNKWLESSGMMF